MEFIILEDNLQILHQQWLNHDEGTLVVYALSFLDVKNLLLTERVNKTWRDLCKKTISGKIGQEGPRAFESNQELRDAVRKYSRYKTAAVMEEFACTYGYPINKWDVSQLEDLSHVCSCPHFDDYIGSWDVSNATCMSHMFSGASSFNHWILGGMPCDSYDSHVLRRL
jgi:hypothetical protein